MSEAPIYRNALPLGGMLHEYRLDSVLGAGGFGMTYLAWDINLEKHVAIKEYLPGELAVRALDGSIVPVNTESEYNYKWGLDRFIQEARTLAKFSHPNIVRVNRFFETNGTSYMVMDYEAGESLYQYLKRNPSPGEEWLKQMLMPILDGLQAVHRAGFLHRDIKPSNVFIRENGTPVLLDFGSARLATGGASKNLTAIISPGYAPLEQYAADGNQGPWSDIYALAGVMYRAVTSENPPDAVKRMRDDSVPVSLRVARARYDERFLRAIEWGMQVEERVRPKDVAEWRELFSGRAPATALNRGGVTSREPPTAVPTVLPTALPTARAAPAAAAAPTRTAEAVSPDTVKITQSRLLTRTRWKWLRRTVFLALMAGAALVYFKQRAIEKSLQAAAQQRQMIAPELERRMTQRFEATDADRSGAISREELARRLPAYASRFGEIDGNGDGMVSMSELTAFMQRQGLADELRDSELASTLEKVPAEKAAAASPKPATVTIALPPSKPSSVTIAVPPSANEAAVPAAILQEMASADRDGNGFLTPDEVRGRFPYIEQNFSQVDSNGDGKISPAELAQLRKQQLLQKMRR